MVQVVYVQLVQLLLIHIGTGRFEPPHRGIFLDTALPKYCSYDMGVFCVVFVVFSHWLCLSLPLSNLTQED